LLHECAEEGTPMRNSRKVLSRTLAFSAVLSTFAGCSDEVDGPLVEEEIVLRRGHVDLDVAVLVHPLAPACSSGQLTLRNSAVTVMKPLAFAGARATLRLRGVATGTYRVEYTCAETVIDRYLRKVTTATAEVAIGTGTTGLIFEEPVVHVADRRGTSASPLAARHLFEYSLVARGAVQAVVRVPLDPSDPFFEASAPGPSWSYLYADRTFFDTGPDGTSGFLRGSAAFERYGELAHVLGTAEFQSVVDTVASTVWTRADSLVILVDDLGEELLLYHVWPEP
jgi:hypothetical protein